jgi:hypothetical protein
MSCEELKTKKVIRNMLVQKCKNENIRSKRYNIILSVRGGYVLEDREKLRQEKITAEEKVEMIRVSGIKQKVWNVLIKERKYAPGDIEVDPEFRLLLSDCETTVSIDFIINISSVSFMAIKCAATALESWQRYAISFARAIKDYQIPYAMVTDGENARIMDVLTGSLVSESLNGFFNKQEAVNIMKDVKKIPCPSNRLEREKRIIYAFEGIKCPPVGGVKSPTRTS